MKQFLILPNLMLLLSFAMLMVSCQKNEIASEDEITVVHNQHSKERCIPRCDDCPVMTHCCCEVRIVNLQQDGDLRFCGDFHGCTSVQPCIINATITCPPIDGIFFDRSVAFGDTLLICNTQDEAFLIRNMSMFSVLLEVECQQSSGPPTVIPIDLSLGEFAIIELDGGCIPDQCN